MPGCGRRPGRDRIRRRPGSPRSWPDRSSTRSRTLPRFSPGTGSSCSRRPTGSSATPSCSESPPSPSSRRSVTGRSLSIWWRSTPIPREKGISGRCSTSGSPCCRSWARQSYLETQRGFDDGLPPGQRWESWAHYLIGLGDDATFLERVEPYLLSPDPRCRRRSGSTSTRQDWGAASLRPGSDPTDRTSRLPGSRRRCWPPTSYGSRRRRRRETTGSSRPSTRGGPSPCRGRCRCRNR